MTEAQKREASMRAVNGQYYELGVLLGQSLKRFRTCQQPLISVNALVGYTFRSSLFCALFHTNNMKLTVYFSSTSARPLLSDRIARTSARFKVWILYWRFGVVAGSYLVIFFKNVAGSIYTLLIAEKDSNERKTSTLPSTSRILHTTNVCRIRTNPLLRLTSLYSIMDIRSSSYKRNT